METNGCQLQRVMGAREAGVQAQTLEGQAITLPTTSSLPPNPNPNSYPYSNRSPNCGLSPLQVAKRLKRQRTTHVRQTRSQGAQEQARRPQPILKQNVPERERESERSERKYRAPAASSSSDQSLRQSLRLGPWVTNVVHQRAPEVREESSQLETAGNVTLP